MSLQLGTAKVDITPEPGLPLMGNFRDDYAARGVLDSLHAKALVIDDGRTKAAVLTLDVCMLDRDDVELIRRTIAQQCSIPPQQVLVHATHTHSAPATNGRFSCNLDFKPYRPRIQEMLRLAASAVALAQQRLSPAKLSVGSARETRISFNRRLRRRDGSTQMNWESLSPGFDPQQVERPWGPTDPEVLCLHAECDSGDRAVAVNFALHPAILAGDNWLYSADYPGQLAAALTSIHGPRLACMFLNGCAGNVNHVDYTDPSQGRGHVMTERVGYMLAAAASEAMRSAVPLPGEPLAIARQTVELVRLPISDAEYARCRAVIASAGGASLAGQVDGLPEMHFASVRVEMYQDQHKPDQVEVFTLRLGELAIVGLPGENFCEIGLDIKRRSPARWTMVLGLSNDAIGYLPTRESSAQGGYEPMIGSTFYEPGSAERLADAAVEQLNRLFSKS